MRLVINLMIFAGSALMIYNIIRYGAFVKNSRELERSRGGGLIVPLLLLFFFLIGYVAVGISGIANLLMAAILLVAMWRKFGPYLTETLGNTPGVGLRLGLLAGGLVLLLAAAVWLLWRMREKGGIWSKVWGFVLGLKDGLVSFTQMKDGWLFLLITAVIWTVYTLMCHTILLALQDIPAYAGMGLTDAFFLMILGSFASVVPVPGGFGAYHSLVAGALASVWGMPFATGMIFATLSHESQAVTQAFVGIASYLHESFFRKS